MIGIPSDLKDVVVETRAGMKQINANLDRVIELLEQLIEIQSDEMRRASAMERLDVSA
ncbi:MAG TPA: hypothetical protein VJ777_14250 [Mycobacterium sp.]|nr:hypothetical protein [Mycobacterium sp.]